VRRGACGIVPLPDAGTGTCVIGGVTCRFGVPCHIIECTYCTCYGGPGGPVSCNTSPGCGGDAGTIDAGVVDAGGPAPSCVRQDARGVGMCAAFFGYGWDGSSCVGLGGCSCAGSDCRSLSLDRDACEAAHRSCPRPL